MRKLDVVTPAIAIPLSDKSAIASRSTLPVSYTHLVGGVRGVAHRAQLHRLAGKTIGALPRMLAFLDEHHLPSGQILGVGALVGEEARFNTTYAPSVEVLVPPEDAHDFAALCDATFHEGADIFQVGDVGAVSLVGQGILEDRSVLREAIALLSGNGIAIAGVTTSSFRMTFLLAPGPPVEHLSLIHI